MNYSEALTGFLKTIKQDNRIFNRFSSVKCTAQHNFSEYITHTHNDTLVDVCVQASVECVRSMGFKGLCGD